MSTRTTTYCDRCPQERAVEPDAVVDTVEVDIADGVYPRIRFTDLCGRCRKRVIDLLDQIALRRPDDDDGDEDYGEAEAFDAIAAGEDEPRE